MSDFKELLDAALQDAMRVDGIVGSAQQEVYRSLFLEELDVLDDAGQVIGRAPRGFCHRLGLRHRAVHVIVRAPDARILVQRRGVVTDSERGRLDISAGGHVAAGEADMAASACREVEEELTLVVPVHALTLIAEYNRDQPSTSRKLDRNRERRYLFLIDVAANELPILPPAEIERKSHGEVTATEWMSVEQIMDAVDRGLAADGLVASIYHYLAWKGNAGR